LKIGLIDVDGHNYPNLALMKLSAWHKEQGDNVEWYDLDSATFHYLETGKNLYDRVYMSKVFSDVYTKDYEYIVYADEVIKGGTGYCISTIDGKEVYDKSKDSVLPYEVEHIYPDYELYGITDTAYGYLTRGCPRGCSFCIVKEKEGRCSYKVADLSEFWRGQKNIVLCDPNIIACPEWKDLLQQLIDSNARVDINQGIDIRMMTEEKAEMIKKLKIKRVHFAWDRYEDKDIVVPKLKMFKEITGFSRHKVVVYMLTNFDTTLKQDYERIFTLRNELNFQPFMMIYNKPSLPKGCELLKMQSWVNNPMMFWICDDLEDFKIKDKLRREKYKKKK